MSELIFKSLFDEESFVKTLAFLHGNRTGGEDSDECMTGYGSIAHRLVFAAVDGRDESEAVHGTVFIRRMIRTLDGALSHKAPFLLCLNGSLADVTGGSELLFSYSELFDSVKKASGKIPLILIVCGECIGVNAVLASLFDFVFLYGEGSTLSALPDTAVNLNSNRNEPANKLKFDSEYTSRNSAAVSGICKDINELKNTLSLLLGYLPDSAASGAPEVLYSVKDESIPKDINKLRGLELCRALCDGHLCFETGGRYGTEAVTAFGRIFGKTIGLISFNTEDTDGLVGIEALKKIKRFRKYCFSFRIPIVNLIDFTGIRAVDGSAFELPGVISELLTNPNGREKCKAISIVTGCACGSLAPVFISARENDAGNLSLAWEGTYIDAINPAASALMKYGDAIKADSDPSAARQKYIALYKSQYSAAVIAAQKGLIDDIIDPSETRLRIAAFLNIL